MLCVTPQYADALGRQIETELGCGPVQCVTDGFDAVEAFESCKPSHVVIDGELDARGGVRIAAALASRRQVPTVLVVHPELQEEVGLLVQRRRLDEVRVVCWDHTKVSSLFLKEGTSSDTQRAEVSAVAARTYDAVVLLGSAGTPHLLPALLPNLDHARVPLVVAVHHNPRLSQSFSEWVGELAKMDPQQLVAGERLAALTVVRTHSGVDALQPDLDTVLTQVHAGGRRLLVIVASGMGFERVDALRTALRDAAVLVALRPESCSQPAMVDRILLAGLNPVLCSQEEIAWLIRAATGAGRTTLRHAG